MLFIKTQSNKETPLGPTSAVFQAYLILTNKDINLIVFGEATVPTRTKNATILLLQVPYLQ